MHWREIQGQSTAIDMLRRAAARGRLAHGYLFLGPAGIGKRQVARTLAQALFCPRSGEELEPCGECPACRQVQAGSHPDLFEIGCPEGKRELPIDLIAGAKDKRGREGLCHDITLRPMSADRRVAIIDDAHTMNEESANALLKTLEEPPEGSILILISPELEPILPTIRSRCQPLWFAPLPLPLVESLLREADPQLDPAAAAAAARLSGGSLDTARRLLDPALAALRSTIRSGLARPALDGGALHTAVLEIVEQGADTAAQREFAGWAIQMAIEHYREVLAADAADPYDACDRAAAGLNRCIDAAGHLHQSMPASLCLAGLFDDLARVGRTGATAFS
ncbi:MAG: DNA polymerase III subunit delta' [Planctomyces sp.]|nr:DNA polymerase III subunit delta' [Planctomyces sp.]